MERPEIIKLTVQRKKFIIQEKINRGTKPVELPQAQFLDKCGDMPVVVQRQASMAQTVQKDVEVPLSQLTDKAADIPVVAQRQIFTVQTVQTRKAIPQLHVEVIDVPAVFVVLVPQVHDEMKTVETTQLQPVEQLPHVHVVKKTVEDAQLQVVEKIGEIPEDFPVCIPRETLQQNKILCVVKKTLVKSRLEMLAEIECDEGHELMSQGNESVSTAEDVEDDANEVSEKYLDCMVRSSGSTRQQHKQRATTQTAQEKEQGREEREKGRKGQRGRGQEGRKKEEREAEEGGSELVEKDVTGWTEVTRNKRKKVVQIFVKVDGMKTVAMEVSPEDRVQKILNTVSGSERDVYVTSGGRILRGSDKLKSFGVRDGSTVEVTSRMRGGGGKHREKKSKKEKEWSGNPKKIEQAHGQKVEVQPSRNVDEMYVLMEEQMRLMREEAKSLHVTGEVMRRIVEHVVKMRLMAENMKKQASDDDLQCVEKMERGLKVFMEEVRDRQKELEMRETKEEQNVKMSPEDEVGRKATREGRGCAGLVQRGNETHRMNETCGKGKGKGNGGKGEHGGKGEDGGKGHEGTRRLRWADCEEEEGARQGAAEGEWHRARREQGIMWLDGSYEEQEGHEGSAGGERCDIYTFIYIYTYIHIYIYTYIHRYIDIHRYT